MAELPARAPRLAKRRGGRTGAARVGVRDFGQPRRRSSGGAHAKGLKE